MAIAKMKLINIISYKDKLEEDVYKRQREGSEREPETRCLQEVRAR